MDWKKANLDICNALVKGELVRAQKTEGDEILVIPSPAYYGYLFNPKDIIFSMAKLQMLPATAHMIFSRSVIAPENEIKATKDLRLLTYKKAIARKFVADGRKTWVDTKLLKQVNVDTCKFYQAKSLEAVIVVDEGVPVMCVLPIRMMEDEEE